MMNYGRTAPKTPAMARASRLVKNPAGTRMDPHTMTSKQQQQADALARLLFAPDAADPNQGVEPQHASLRAFRDRALAKRAVAKKAAAAAAKAASAAAADKAAVEAVVVIEDDEEVEIFFACGEASEDDAHDDANDNNDNDNLFFDATDEIFELEMVAWEDVYEYLPGGAMPSRPASPEPVVLKSSRPCSAVRIRAVCDADAAAADPNAAAEAEPPLPLSTPAKDNAEDNDHNVNGRRFEAILDHELDVCIITTPTSAAGLATPPLSSSSAAGADATTPTTGSSAGGAVRLLLQLEKQDSLLLGNSVDETGLEQPVAAARRSSAVDEDEEAEAAEAAPFALPATDNANDNANGDDSVDLTYLAFLGCAAPAATVPPKPYDDADFAAFLGDGPLFPSAAAAEEEEEEGDKGQRTAFAAALVFFSAALFFWAPKAAICYGNDDDEEEDQEHMATDLLVFLEAQPRDAKPSLLLPAIAEEEDEEEEEDDDGDDEVAPLSSPPLLLLTAASADADAASEIEWGPWVDASSGAIVCSNPRFTAEVQEEQQGDDSTALTVAPPPAADKDDAEDSEDEVALLRRELERRAEVEAQLRAEVALAEWRHQIETAELVALHQAAEREVRELMFAATFGSYNAVCRTQGPSGRSSDLLLAWTLCASGCAVAALTAAFGFWAACACA